MIKDNIKPKKLQLLLHAIKYHWLLSGGIFILVFLLLVIYWPGFSKLGFKQGVWSWVDPVAGIMTFITTLVIFGMQAYKNWEQSLEKRLNVKYIFTGEKNDQLLAHIKGAYLAGENDTRAWAQQLGNQIMGNLDFDMNWDDPKPEVLKDNFGRYFKVYNINIYLTSNPLSTAEGKTKAIFFLQRKFKHSLTSGGLENLPIMWERIEV
ncbi:MAG TPA: hypothetical protein PLU49_13645 [Saprospiraceae bacterium]|nr:hypothetical protein [Saprospiraceae bacterium]